mmetsp:Transcript_69466/g.165609  ORF Transcript_69466/g.165609 Transcript_69466/m.165609 type:complete len:218 (-) Transcript_69466:395-1048(-)
MPNLQVSDYEISASCAKAGRAEPCGGPGNSPEEVLVDEQGWTINANHDAHVTAEHGCIGGWNLRFAQRLEVVCFLSAEPGESRRLIWRQRRWLGRLCLLLGFVCFQWGGDLNRAAIHLSPPSPSCSRGPEDEALVRPIALADRPQALAEEGPENAVARILHYHDAGARVCKLSIHRSQRNAIDGHTVTQNPAWSYLQQHRQAADDASQQIAASFRQD